MPQARSDKHICRFLLLAASLAFLEACGANEGILRSGKETPLPANVPTSAATAESDIADMRTADFQFIYVLRRTDLGQIGPDDRSLIKVLTAEMNRRVSSEGGKAIVIGSNSELAPEKMAALAARFTIENYSPAPAVDQANPANANK